jgi:hypothetical protein
MLTTVALVALGVLLLALAPYPLTGGWVWVAVLWALLVFFLLLGLEVKE